MAAEEEGEVPALQDICYTASVRRTHHDHRLALPCHSHAEMAESLGAFLQGEASAGLSSGRVSGRERKLVFVFPGQGSQWLGMGQQLLEQQPVFRATLEACDQAMREHVDWSLLAELTADPNHSGLAHSRLDEIDIVQPAIFAIQVGLAALWRSWGVEPDAVVGQSMGEVAAAYVAGALSLEDAARVICRRSRLLKRVSGQGAMAAVELSLEQAEQALAGYEDRVSIAVSSSPTSTVLSGDPAALQEITDALERQDIFCRMIKVDVASHSPQMDPLGDDLSRELEGMQPLPASIPIYSTVTGAAQRGLSFDATYWMRNLREPVLFSAAVSQLLEDGHDIFLELSPHPISLSAIQQGLHHRGQEAILPPSLRREEDERATLLGSLGALYTAGQTVDWPRLFPAGAACVSLPAYPWQREHFWLESLEPSIRPGRAWTPSAARRNRSGEPAHPLLGQYLRSAAQPGMRFWEIDLSLGSFPYLNDHRIQGLAVLPAAVYVEMALAAATEAFGAGSHALEKVAFRKALFLPEEGAQTLQLVLSSESPATASFQFFSLQTGDGQSTETWTLHASGTIRLAQTEAAVTPPPHSLEQIQAQCPEAVSAAEHYQATQEAEVFYGPSFQGVEQLWRRDREAIGRLRLPEAVAPEAARYRIHPALLDSCFQVLGAALPRDGAEGIYLPVGLDHLRLDSRPDTVAWGHAQLRPGEGANAETLEGDVFLLDEGGEVVLEARGLSLQRLDRGAFGATQVHLGDWLYEIAWQLAPRPQDSVGVAPDKPGSWLIFTDSGGVGEELKSLLEARGETCLMGTPSEAYQSTAPGRYQLNPARREDFRRLFEDVLANDLPPCRGVVHLWSLEASLPEEATTAGLERAQILGCGSVLYLIQALAEAGQSWWIGHGRLWLLTSGAQAVGLEGTPASVIQSPLWGFGRSIISEYPELRTTIVDLSPASSPDEVHSLFRELWSDDQENQIALRGDDRLVARLTQRRLAPAAESAPDEEKLAPAGDQPFRLETLQPGILDHLTLRASARRVPGPGEVEIEVCAAGLNFSDVMKAMGIYPGLPAGPVPLGVECAGRIAALGDGVSGFEVGDEVIAIAPFSFGAFVTTAAAFVAPKPPALSFEEAATIPIAFLTAYYSLCHLGRLGQGERALIHAASGGVGLAAIQLAQRAGAEVFATAGSPEKREFLRSLGVEHVFDSRSLAFADEVMERTSGQGVDVVLNSLAGEAIPKSLSILAPYGRFLEIGKADIYQNSQLGLRPFQKNLSFFAIDLDRLFRERPALIGSLFREFVQYFKDGDLKPIPLQVFPISEAAGAFRHMAQAKHIGKIVLSLREGAGLIAPSSEAPDAFRADATYLITGGTGGIGLLLASWMVEQGARHLVLMGRSGRLTAAAEEALEVMRKAGAHVVIAKADVSQEEQVAIKLSEIAQSMPPLRGVIHAAGILNDGILLQMDQEQLMSVMAPKASGAWNLHTLTLNAPLDFFVLFSSGASLLGSPGQANYSAANAFLDALAHYRQALGRPALSVNWGYWGGIGMVAQADRARRLESRGILSFTPEQGMDMLGQLLRQDRAQVAVMPVNWRRLLRLHSTASELPLLSDLLREQATAANAAGAPKEKGGALREALLAAPPEERRQLLESHLRAQVARVVGMSASKLDVQQPLNRLGIDSLMAVELKNRIELDLGTTIPVAKLLQGPSVALLTDELLASLPASSSEDDAAKVAQLLDQLDQLSEDEVKAILEQKGAIPATVAN